MANLKIYYQNFRGLKTKTKDLRLANLLHDYDVIVGTETWLDSGVYDNELLSDSYNIYRRDRESTSLTGKIGGGVIIAVSVKYHSKRIKRFESSVEDLWVSIKISSGDSKYTLFGAIYLPPPISTTTMDSFLENCNEVILSHSGDVVILGDFNLSFIDWVKDTTNTSVLMPTNYNCNLGYLLIDFMSLNNLSQFNHVRNHNNRSLDLILSNIEDIYVKNCINPLCKIDQHHPALEIILSRKTPLLLEQKQFATYNYKKADYSLVTKELSKIDWITQLSEAENVNIAVSKFYQIIYSIIESTIPKAKPRKFKFPPWFSRNLIKLIAENNKIRKKHNIYHNPRDEIEINLNNKRIRLLTSLCYSEHIKNIEQALKNNPKKIWSYAKELRCSSSNLPSEMFLDDKIARNREDICNLFASHFSSTYCPIDQSIPPDVGSSFPQLSLSNINITERDIEKVLKMVDPSKGAGPDGIPPYFIKKTYKYLTLPLKILFQKSIVTEEFPNEWKLANVIPIYKKGDKCNIRNYRPVSILSLFPKILERLLCPLITSHLSKIISNFQHGFSARRSTVTNLLGYVSDLAYGVDKRTEIDSIYTDFSSAFDRVNHNILLCKLKLYGIHGNLLNWVKSYLYNRIQRVTTQGFKSFSFFPTSGVPQGSHLGPILFLAFINDISNHISFSNYSIFADDLKLYKEINYQNDIMELQADLNSICNWCTINKMDLNTKKCIHIKFSTKRNVTTSSYSIAGENLAEATVVRDLGVMIDKKLKFVDHIDKITCSAWKMLGFLKRVCKDLNNPTAILILYKALIRSGLEYASPVWNPSYKVHSDRIERVQRNFTRYLAYKDRNCPYRADYNTRLSYFRLEPLEKRRKICDLKTLHKLIHGQLISPDLLSLINIKVPRSVPRYPLKKVFSLSNCRTNIGSHAPVNRLMQTYNNISSNSDVDIFHTDNLNKFINLCCMNL